MCVPSGKAHRLLHGALAGFLWSTCLSLCWPVLLYWLDWSVPMPPPIPDWSTNASNPMHNLLYSSASAVGSKDYKWIMSDEASWEVEGLQQYIAALSGYDMEVQDPVHVSSALDLPATAFSEDYAAISMGTLLDARFFWRSLQYSARALFDALPLNWGHLYSIASLNFGVDPFGFGFAQCTVESASAVAPHTIFLTSALPGGAPKPKLAAGWCPTKHTYRAKAQSGYRGDDGLLYCRPCLRRKFPERYAEKQAGRRKPCSFCGGVKELIGGFCKPCRTVRACNTCSAVNLDASASQCQRCLERRLVVWCTGCSNETARSSGLCQLCYRKFGEIPCDLCQVAGGELHSRHVCPAEDCEAVVHVCKSCAPLRVGGRVPRCRRCWSSSGGLCVLCGCLMARPVRTKYRCCKKCYNAWFCSRCGNAPQSSHIPGCTSCARGKALWCAACCSDAELASGLCRSCFRKADSGTLTVGATIE